MKRECNMKTNNSDTVDSKLLERVIEQVKSTPKVTWGGGNVVGINKDGTEIRQWPYPEYPEGLFESLYELVGTDRSYSEYRAKIGKSADYSQLTLFETRALIEHLLRGERFCDGMIADSIESGELLKILERMRAFAAEDESQYHVKPLPLSGISIHTLEPGAGATEEQKNALIYAKSFFESRRGLGNDFIFPGSSVLDKLDKQNRTIFEYIIIRECNKGDSRFFSALKDIKTVDPFDYTDPSRFEKYDKECSARGEMLENLFINNNNLQALLYLLKMAASNSLAYYRLANIIEKTDWDMVDTESKWFRLFTSAIRTFLSMKRIRQTETSIYEKLFKAKLLKYLEKVSMLSLEDLPFFLRSDPWTSCPNYDPLVFFKSLEKREMYLRSKDASYINSLIQDILSYPEAYDVFLYMRQKKEVDASQFVLQCVSRMQNTK